MKNDYQIPLVTSLDDITDKYIKEEINFYLDKDYVLGFMLWGSRATQFGEPDTDYDALIYVTQEFFDKLAKKDIAILKFNEKVTPKKLIIDFTYWADSIFEDQLQSPMDIDHSAYSEATVLYDKTGKLEEWRSRLAYYPKETQEERIKIKWINIMVSFEYATKNKVRNNELDLKINLYRTLTMTGNLLFNLYDSWAPPMKWWSKYAIKCGIDDDLFNIYAQALENVTLENTKLLIDKLKERIINSGINLDSLTEAFFETIYPEGRKKLLKYSYF